MRDACRPSGQFWALVLPAEELLNEAEKGPFEGPIPEECRCLSSCRTLHYHGEATSFDFPWNMERMARRQNVSTEGWVWLRPGLPRPAATSQ